MLQLFEALLVGLKYFLSTLNWVAKHSWVSILESFDVDITMCIAI
jgi:hypothetical protein